VGNVDVWHVGANKRLYVRTKYFGGWYNWDASPNKDVAGNWIPPNVYYAPAALRVSSNETFLIARDFYGAPFFRRVYDTVPAAEVQLAQDMSMQGPHHGTDVAGCSPPPTPDMIWETSVLAVPPGKAGCGANGGLIYDTSSGGGDPPDFERPLWSGSLSCFQGAGGVVLDGGVPQLCTGSQSPQCPMTGYNTYSMAAGWLTDLVLEVGNPPGGKYNLADDQMGRVGAIDAGVPTLLNLKHARIVGSQSSPQSQAKGSRGAPFFYSSTSCGQTWSLLSLIDPCGSNMRQGAACPAGAEVCTQDNGWDCDLDRPDMAVSPTDPNKIFVTARSNYHGLLYRSTNGGQSWSQAKDYNNNPVVNVNQ
jgi:hypothetical protein